MENSVASFLFGGFVIPFEDLYPPWTVIYYIMPFRYYVRSAMYEAFAYASFETCELGSYSAVCLQEETPGAGVPGVKIIEAFRQVVPLASTEDTTVRDTMILIAIGCLWKTMYAFGVIIKTRQVAVIENPTLTEAQMNGNVKPVQHRAAGSLKKHSADVLSQTLQNDKLGYIPFAMPDDLSEELSV